MGYLDPMLYLVMNPFEEVTIEDMETELTITGDRMVAFIDQIWVESDEVRAGDTVKVSFQTDDVIDEATYPELTGYLADSGMAYELKDNGRTYGWLDSFLDPDDQFEARDRGRTGASR